jgi:predicted transcriptional regulator YdeE
MDTQIVDKDIKVLAIEVKAFPQGIQEAFDKLNDLVGGDQWSRNVFGISHGSRDGVVYYAAISQNFDGEAEELNCEELVVPAGIYAVKRINNWREQLQNIGNAFCELMQEPDFDQVTPCIEWYQNPDQMLCMVKLNHVTNNQVTK